MEQPFEFTNINRCGPKGTFAIETSVRSDMSATARIVIDREPLTLLEKHEISGRKQETGENNLYRA